MSDKINIEDILKKYPKVFYEDSPDSLGTAIEYYDVKTIIKEIVEAVVDKCAEEVDYVCTDGSNKIYSNEIDKDSILQVKQMINYE